MPSNSDKRVGENDNVKSKRISNPTIHDSVPTNATSVQVKIVNFQCEQQSSSFDVNITGTAN